MKSEQPLYFFEPLGDQDRSTFSCGVAELDEYLQARASQDAKRKVAVPFVLADRDRRVLGYYTLSAYTVRPTELPEDVSRKLPSYPMIGRLAVSWDRRGQGLGSLLLMDALYRSWRNSSQVASAGVVAEAMNDTARRFYLHHEFLELPEQPRKLFIAMTTIQKAFA